MTASVTDCLPATEVGFTEREARWGSAIDNRLAPMTIRIKRDLGPQSGEGVWSRCVGDLALTEWKSPPMQGWRSRGRVRQSAQRGLAIFVGYGGRERMSFGGGDVLLERGSVVVVSSDAVGEFAVPEWISKRTLLLPEAVLTAAEHGKDLPGCLLLQQDRPLVGLFRSYLDQVWHQAPGMTAQEAEAARAALVALAVGAIRAEEGPAIDGSVLGVLRARLNDWITDNLRRGPIRVADLAAAHNVSARTVHRAFSSTGDTMTSVVRSRRLAAARDDIVRTQLTMTTIANRWGFYDPSHLAREFRRHYGLSPASYRDSHGYC